MTELEKIVVLQELKRDGLLVSAIARRTCMDRKTVRKLLDRGLPGRRLLREIREFGYEGGYTAVTDYLRAIRPDVVPRVVCPVDAWSESRNMPDVQTLFEKPHGTSVQIMD